MYEPSPELKKLEAEKAEAEQQLMQEQCGCRERVPAGKGAGRSRVLLPCGAHLLYAGNQRYGDGGSQCPQCRRAVGR